MFQSPLTQLATSQLIIPRRNYCQQDDKKKDITPSVIKTKEAPSKFRQRGNHERKKGEAGYETGKQNNWKSKERRYILTHTNCFLQTVTLKQLW